MKNIESGRTAVVFGLFETGLAVIRALGRRRVGVVGIDHKRDIACYSRYAKTLRCPHPVEQESRFIEWLADTFDGYSRLPVFLTGDDFLYAFSKNRGFLSKFFVFNLPDMSMLNRIADKYSQYQMALDAGVEAPGTWLVEKLSDLEELAPQFQRWPLFIKGREVNAWRAYFGGKTKGFSVRSYDELREKLTPALLHGVPVIIQEVIKGPDTNHYKYCAYVSKDGDTLAEFCLRKIRQNPIRFGIGAVVESVRDDRLLEQGRRFFSGIGYRGVGSAEFKYDQDDGRLKLIELNPRYWQQNGLTERCGINFAYINYQDLLGEAPVPRGPDYQPGIKWVNIYMDIDSFLSYRKAGELTFGQWRQSLRGPKMFSDYAKDDILPLFWEIRFGLKLLKLPVFLFKKLTR